MRGIEAIKPRLSLWRFAKPFHRPFRLETKGKPAIKRTAPVAKPLQYRCTVVVVHGQLPLKRCCLFLGQSRVSGWSFLLAGPLLRVAGSGLSWMTGLRRELEETAGRCPCARERSGLLLVVLGSLCVLSPGRGMVLKDVSPPAGPSTGDPHGLLLCNKDRSVSLQARMYDCLHVCRLRAAVRKHSLPLGHVSGDLSLSPNPWQSLAVQPHRAYSEGLVMHCDPGLRDRCLSLPSIIPQDNARCCRHNLRSSGRIRPPPPWGSPDIPRSRSCRAPRLAAGDPHTTPCRASSRPSTAPDAEPEWPGTPPGSPGAIPERAAPRSWPR